MKAKDLGKKFDAGKEDILDELDLSTLAAFLKRLDWYSSAQADIRYYRRVV